MSWFNQIPQLFSFFLIFIQNFSFPGGALFLFEAKNEKTIVHVGDFRLPSELEADEILIKIDIDEVRFDQV